MQIRPRLTPEEYEIVLAWRDGKINYKPCKQSEKKPRILVFDIETAPIKASLFGIWKQNVNLDFIKSDWFMLCWAAKYIGEDDIYFDCIKPEEVVNDDDKRITESLWNIIDGADVIIAHNGKGFDIPRMNTRFLFHGLTPPSPYQVIDTLQVLRKEFAISSNRLDYVNKWLGLEGKKKTEASLWIKCMAGDIDALNEMSEYNIKDVDVLENSYMKIRSWIKGHPNSGTYVSDVESVCPVCGSENLSWDGGHKHTQVGKYPSFRCSDCGYVGQSRKNVLGREKMKNLIK